MTLRHLNDASAVLSFNPKSLSGDNSTEDDLVLVIRISYCNNFALEITLLIGKHSIVPEKCFVCKPKSKHFFFDCCFLNGLGFVDL